MTEEEICAMEDDINSGGYCGWELPCGVDQYACGCLWAAKEENIAMEEENKVGGCCG